MSIYTPASSYLSPTSDNSSQYEVVSQVGYEVTVKGSNLQVGQILDFGETRGLVVKADDISLVRLMSPEPVRVGALLKIIKNDIVPYRLLIENESVGSLSVKCKVDNENFIGWSLYLDRTLIAVGNDKQRPGLCSISSSGLWQKGTYTLRARLFQPPSFNSIGTASTSWVITDQVSKLSAGNFDDGAYELQFL